MTATRLYRIAVVLQLLQLLLLFAAGHTMGLTGFKPPSPEGLAVPDAMDAVPFDLKGSKFTCGRFHRGFGLTVAVYLVFSLPYFFLAPALFSGLVVLCLAGAAWLVRGQGCSTGSAGDVGRGVRLRGDMPRRQVAEHDEQQAGCRGQREDEAERARRVLAIDDVRHHLQAEADDDEAGAGRDDRHHRAGAEARSEPQRQRCDDGEDRRARIPAEAEPRAHGRQHERAAAEGDDVAERRAERAHRTTCRAARVVMSASGRPGVLMPARRAPDGPRPTRAARARRSG
jgi:hypothetical protein